MTEQREGEGGIPPGPFDFGFDGAFVGVLPQDVDGEFADQGEILGGVVRAYSGGVL